MPPIASDEYSSQHHRMNRLKSHSVSETMISTRKETSEPFNKKKYSSRSVGESASQSVCSYYGSNKSSCLSVQTQTSHLTSNLTEFYSSRRSITLTQENTQASTNESSLTNRAWNDNKGQKPDTSPRRPRRGSVTSAAWNENEGPKPRLSPRKSDTPCTEQTSTNEAPKEDAVIPQMLNLNARSLNQQLRIDTTNQSDRRDILPRMPQKRKSMIASSTEQEIHTTNPGNTSSIVDTIPQYPDRHGSCDEQATSNISQETCIQRGIVVEIPIEGILPHTIKKGSGISVTSDISCQSNEEKAYSRLKMTVPLNHRSALLRRQTSQKSFESSFSQGSTMSIQSHLSLSIKIRSLIELAADVVNSENLEVAAKYYQKSIHAAGSEIMSINIQMGEMIGQDSSDSTAAREGCHEDLRLIGIIIGLLRTKMAILYGSIGEYDRAIDLCKGAVQVHRHQPVLKSISSNPSDVNDVTGLMVLIIERLEKSQVCFEDHKELLDKIDMHSVQLLNSEVCASSKVIVHDMLEKSTDKSLNIQDDVLEVLSVHTAKQDKHLEGIMYLRDALQIHLVALGLKHPHTSKSLIHVARMYRGIGNDRSNERLVLGYFQQTAEVLQRSNLSQQSRASVLNDIAVIHMRRKMFDEAIKFLLDALYAYDDSIEDDDMKQEHNICTLQIWRNLGDCYMQLFKFKSAEGALLKALHIQRDCVKLHEFAEKLEINAMKINESILNLSNDICIADTICQIGKARAGGGSYKQALDIYREALRVLNRNASADLDRSNAELLKKRDQLTHLLYCIAEAERANDELEKSLQMYFLSLRLRKSNEAEVMDKRKATRIHCLSCFLGIIEVYIKQKKFNEARNQIKEAMTYAVQSQVKKTHPIVLAIQKKAKDCEQAISEFAMRNPDVDALEKKADAEIERGALDMATETLRQLLVIRRSTLKEMKTRGEDTKDQVYAIACLLQTFGFVFAKNGDDENAERAFKDASRLFRKGGSPSEANDPNMVQI